MSAAGAVVVAAAVLGSLRGVHAQGAAGGPAAATDAMPREAPGAAVFADHCAACHAGNDPRTRTVAAWRQRSPESILDALTIGLNVLLAFGVN